MKVLVVDDHVLIRDALRGVLTDLGGITQIIEARDATEANNAVAGNVDVGLVLLDIDLPDRDGLTVLSDLRRMQPTVAVAMLSAHQDRDSVLRSLTLGAVGFIPKSSSRDVMIGALRLILAGGVYIPPVAIAPAATELPSPPKATPQDLGLTERQLEVLALLMKGKSNKWICRSLDLAEPTVKHHVTAILKALKASNRTEAVLAVTALGWKLPDVG